jgi:hypothetical protein
VENLTEFRSSASAAFSIVNELGEAYMMPCLLETPEGLLVNVTQFSISIKVKTVDGDKEIPIIQQTPKRDKGPQMVCLFNQTNTSNTL